MNKAIFLDRDGTLCEDRNYLRRPEDIRILPGVVPALQRLQQEGYRLIVVTNQSGVARGMFTEEELAGIHAELVRRFRAEGILFGGIYHCPHLEEGERPEYSRSCDCRKPQPGLLLQAATEHGIELSRSFMIGDKSSDIGAGRLAGCRTVLLGDRASLGEAVDEPSPDWVAPDLPSAAEWILRTEEA